MRRLRLAVGGMVDSPCNKRVRIEMWRASGVFAILYFACAKPPDIVIMAPSGQVNVPQPVKLEGITSAHDGGTIAFIIKGRNGKEVPVCLDGRMSVPLNERYSYIGAVYPTQPGASVMKDGSELQTAILNSTVPHLEYA